MKKIRISCLALCLAMFFTLGAPAAAAQAQVITVDPINVMVGGKDFLPTDVTGKDVPVFAYNGTTYAPLRALAEVYGLNVGYNAEKQLATVEGTPSADFVGSKGTTPPITKRTTLTVSPINIEVNGAVFEPTDVTGKRVPVFAYNGTTYAPLRALAEAYGLSVGYNGERRLATVDFVSTEGINFAALLAEVNAARKAELQQPLPFDGYTDYLVDDPATRTLLTDGEINDLLNTPDQDVDTVTADEARSDIDLLFRAMHTTYGAYYYFGEEAWDNAEAEVLAWIDGQATVSVEDLTDVLRRSLAFMVDNHSFVGYDLDRLEGVRYEYHYCTAQQFARDGQGYYKLVNGERIDFVGCSDQRVTLSPTLLADGTMVWSPVLHCPANQVRPATVTLKNAAGETYTETVSWTASKDDSELGLTPGQQPVILAENGLAYVRIGHYDGSRDAERSAYAAAAAQAKKAKAVIFDLRGNTGNAGNPLDQWLRAFAGSFPEERQAKADRRSTLAAQYEDRHATGTMGTYELDCMDRGKWLSNNIPVIVLVDDGCGSNGESALSMLKTMDNVLVIGTNSSGCQLGGNCVDINLPHSNIDASIGTMLWFRYEIKNVDFIGYAPDVWCESGPALDAALNLLVNAGIVDGATARDFGDSVAALLPSDDNSDAITLDIRGDQISGDRFGIGRGTHVVTVLLNGNPVSDFTVTSSDPNLIQVQKASNCTFEMVANAPDTASVTVQCGDVQRTFGVIGRI